MIDETNYQEEKEGSLLQTRRKFYSELTSQIWEINLSEAARKKCMGVYPGWILTVDLDDLQIHLLNPFTRWRFSLPSMLHFKDQYEYNEEFKPEEVADMFVKKVVPLSSPEQDDCILLAIYREFRILAFARLVDEVWTNINVSTKVFDDAVYYQGKFYVVDRHGVVFVCDVDHKDGPTTTIVVPASSDPRLDGFKTKYLVESCGDIYLVSREHGGYIYDDECTEEERMMRRYYIVELYVFKLVRDDDGSIYPYRSENVDDLGLGDMAFFLGNNASSAIPSSSDCVRANSIYFSDDHDELWLAQIGGGGHDTWIFDMETGDIDWHYVSHQFQFRSQINPSFWLL